MKNDCTFFLVFLLEKALNQKSCSHFVIVLIHIIQAKQRIIMYLIIDVQERKIAFPHSSQLRNPCLYKFSECSSLVGTYLIGMTILPQLM